MTQFQLIQQLKRQPRLGIGGLDDFESAAKTVFNNLQTMEKGAEKRFNGIDEQTSKIETIILSSAGFLIVTLAGIVGTMLSMH